MSLTPSVKQYVNEKIGNLGKFIVATDAKVELERDKHHKSGQVFRAEVMLIVGGKVMRGETRAEDVYAAIDLVIPKIKDQIGKFKDKKQTLTRRGARSAKRKN
ncbi:MAG: ribosomal subunit interface protein [Candidatus Doudnabacteria bacterium RIFCSPLOWO2_02_FULL_42_9]|uniref:Ribosomal subunit interface protein n=1 Tax=Candidatus Doudnabacteria bacterium RIFCSPHIGHO2_01_FULL_41_86 TaxID=1817821 RepID=A0A1F5N860_9BACT|nr:MAG: ribosomal subunit interface protein [Candidatus Doudnabacteria bacterium RIFCSPHIGHO2_01_FULL_41_86]OGE75696.1 MAG: ribosomal subunit interface protein [Candidatus Doudnabacteria bacterium RIFCSPHIGHO2_01_43_10]OGE85656.1 MAG: ribosomal subunit interface protein [Candidatus Doudnabacteria bacterium RIFCSPHIGHO2_12_FULL_42_22]OGE87152.1 MAG: ribosomal subunit interface protein [Candidatus Doudnabacteria bacterium RIFCSPHIGHO2_02_FULL_42_25]OGE91990.1 MAG: ribosomal subunit interface prot